MNIESIISNHLNNPAIRGIIINSHDVTKHIEMQEALRNSSRFLNKIIDSIGDPLFVKNREHKWVILNEAFCNFLGYKKEEMLGKNDFSFFKKEEAEFILKIDEIVFNSGQNNIHEEEITDSRGTKYYVSTRKNLFIDEYGAEYIIGTMRDETGKKAAEINMLNSLAKEKELNDLKSTFISMVSHEYRTPLTAILSSAELLELFGSDMNYEEKQEYYDKIKKAVGFLTDLLNDVLLLNRKESGRLDFSPVEFELINFCRELIKESSLGDDHRIIFNSNVESQDVYMDNKLCKYILSNLINNALKYSPDNSSVEFNISYNDRTVNFEVIDQGIGIAEHDQARLFDPFFRAKNAAGVPGSGLGLSIVKNCVELHKGELSFESRLNEGTTFRVSLPSWQEYL
jgi:PAS domain S-box-containing protein